jgi:hypothetical protein
METIICGFASSIQQLLWQANQLKLMSKALKENHQSALAAKIEFIAGAIDWELLNLRDTIVERLSIEDCVVYENSSQIREIPENLKIIADRISESVKNKEALIDAFEDTGVRLV